MIDNESLKKIARIGYAAKGIMYILLGALALQTGLGIGGEITGLKGVLNTIIGQPFGKILLFIIAVGLIAHAVWRFMQSVFDPQNKGKDFKIILERIGHFTSVIVYGGLAFTAFKIIFTNQSSAGGDDAQQYTAGVLSLPMGKYLVIAAGAALIASGIFQGLLAVTGNYKKKFNLNSMTSNERKWVNIVSRFGLISRFIVFLLIGIFLIQAAVEQSAKEAGGLDMALEEILQQPYGTYLLIVVSAGLIAYGGFTFLLAFYHKFYSK